MQLTTNVALFKHIIIDFYGQVFLVNSAYLHVISAFVPCRLTTGQSLEWRVESAGSMLFVAARGTPGGCVGLCLDLSGEYVFMG